MKIHGIIILAVLLLMAAGAVLPVTAVPPQTRTAAPTAADTAVSPAGRPELEAAVGKIIGFGTWEQDNNPANGPEEIEWQVLRVEGNFALVMSVKGLDVRPWHEGRDAVDWDHSSLRAWLNGEFFSSAFSSAEKDRIQAVWNSNPDNTYYDDPVEGGNDTKDRIFLLSIDEVLEYLPDRELRTRKPTAYAIANGAWFHDGDSEDYQQYRGNGWWWLRSPGIFRNSAAYVLSTGDVFSIGSRVDDPEVLACPAFWLNL